MDDDYDLPMRMSDESCVVAIGPCWGCRQLFMFDPDLVPSAVINGVREPLCRVCIVRFNVRRKAEGLEAIVPLPGAYGPEE
jgi:hypothetical protein